MLKSRVAKMLRRIHNFVPRTSYHFEICSLCDRRIGFASIAWKCEDCQAYCHSDCKVQVPLPCIPIILNPYGSKSAHLVTISEYAPFINPRVPALIVHCTTEIERRGLDKVGLYRISGVERDVLQLRNRFLDGKSMPELSSLGIHVITGALKSFLRILKEPLIPRRLWKEMLRATKEEDEMDSFSAVCHVISKMPKPNRDSLAWIILHLKRISEYENIKMNCYNLATVFGPTLVGYSKETPSNYELKAEIKDQKEIMLLLLRTSYDYWETFAERDGEDVEEEIDESEIFIP